MLAALAGASCAGGCLSDASRKRVSETGSILSIVGPPTPGEAAAMMADPFDADRRYKGVTWISNAPWGGADVYMRVYRQMVADPKEDPGVRAVAARGLAFHGTPDDAPLIAPLLVHEDRRVRQTAARALQRVHNAGVIPDLALCVDPTDRAVTRVIVTQTEVEAATAREGVVDKSSGKGDAETFAQAAARASKDPSAATGGLIGPVAAFNSTLPEAVRFAVSRTPEGGVTPVIGAEGRFYVAMVEKRLPGEGDRDVREAAATALGQYADRRSLAALVYALNDDELAVSRAARQSLRVLTGQDQGDEPKRWQAWASAATDPFAGRRRFVYPAFHRKRYWWEYVPLIPGPPNEPASTPIGYRPPGS